MLSSSPSSPPFAVAKVPLPLMLLFETQISYIPLTKNLPFVPSVVASKAASNSLVTTSLSTTLCSTKSHTRRDISSTTTLLSCKKHLLRSDFSSLDRILVPSSFSFSFFIFLLSTTHSWHKTFVAKRKARSFSPADFVSLSNRSSISERDEFDTDEDECMISSSFISSRRRPQSVFVSSLLVYI